MKLNITFTYHYILFLGVALLLAQATFIRPYGKTKPVKIEKISQPSVVAESASEVLHSEMLFRY